MTVLVLYCEPPCVLSELKCLQDYLGSGSSHQRLLSGITWLLVSSPDLFAFPPSFDRGVGIEGKNHKKRGEGKNHKKRGYRRIW